MKEYNIFWFRRDLRLYDNHGLSVATNNSLKVIPIFIFDISITDKLPKDDRRINFIHDNLVKIDSELKMKFNSSLNIFKGDPLKIFKQIISDYKINTVFTNNDYEPYFLDKLPEFPKSYIHEIELDQTCLDALNGITNG